MKQFSIRLDPESDRALDLIARSIDRSRSSTLRVLIRAEARRLALLPPATGEGQRAEGADPSQLGAQRV